MYHATCEINVKMQTIVGISTFMSSLYPMLIRTEREGLIISGLVGLVTVL